MGVSNRLNKLGKHALEIDWDTVSKQVRASKKHVKRVLRHGGASYALARRLSFALDIPMEAFLPRSLPTPAQHMAGQ